MPSPHPLTAWIERIVEPTAAEYAAIARLPAEVLRLPAEATVRSLGEAPSSAFLVSEGFLCASEPVGGDKHQIVAFFIPGDLPDLEALHLGRSGHDIAAITACRLVHFDHRDLHALCAAEPRLAALLWRATLVTASLYREWVVNTGHRPALAALAHLLCELMTRLDAIGFAGRMACDLPLTQTHLSRATGLSLVHVNRSLQELRRRGLLSLGNGRLAIHDWEGLAALGQFREGYLHLPPPRWRAA